MKDYLDKLSKNARLSIQLEFEKSLYCGILQASPVIDRFCTWLLAGYGIAATLFVTNITNIQNLLSIEIIRISLTLLVCGALFGLLQKIYAFKSQLLWSVGENMLTHLNKSYEIYIKQCEEIKRMAGSANITVDLEADFSGIFNNILGSVPYWVRKKMKSGAAAGEKDLLFPYRKSFEQFKRQKKYAILEFLFFVGFVLIIIIYL
jgi:hypothetical protein